MSTTPTPTVHPLDEAASRSRGTVMARMQPKLEAAKGEYIVCFFAPRKREEAPWLVATTGTSGAKITIVGRPEPSESAPVPPIIPHLGCEYLAPAMVFAANETSARIHPELTIELQELYAAGIRLTADYA